MDCLGEEELYVMQEDDALNISTTETTKVSTLELKPLPPQKYACLDENETKPIIVNVIYLIWN